MRRFACYLILWFFALVVSTHAQTLPTINPVTVTGNLSIQGTPALQTLTQAVINQFVLGGYTGEITLNTSTTSAAFTQFCNGEIDIVMASRTITAQEASNCAAIGRNAFELRVATGAVAVVVSEQNPFATLATSPGLQQVFSTALNWNEINADFPPRPIERYGPARGSTPYNIFVDSLFGGDETPLITSIGARFESNTTALRNEIRNREFAIGFFEANEVFNDDAGLRVLSVDGVDANPDTIRTNDYPLAVPLYLYSANNVIQVSPQVGDFLVYYVQNAPGLLSTAALFPIAGTQRQQAITTLFGVLPQRTATPTATSSADSLAATDVAQLPTNTVVITPTPLPTDTATATPTDTPLPTNTPLPADTITPPTTPTQEVLATEVVATQAAPMPFSGETLSTLIAARTDLEAVAIAFLGEGRPPGWSGSLDVNDPQLALLLRLDLEILAGLQYGENTRPDGWFGAVSSTRQAIARDIRHDLEILADRAFGVNMRPATWVGDDPLIRCNRATQALVALLQVATTYTPPPASDDPAYCGRVEREVSRLIEVNLNDAAFGGALAAALQVQATVNTDFAIAYLANNATQRTGIIPQGEAVTPVGRSNVAFSNLMLVEGAGFRLYVDYTDTTITRPQFEVLPAIGPDSPTACEAAWCSPS